MSSIRPQLPWLKMVAVTLIFTVSALLSAGHYDNFYALVAVMTEGQDYQVVIEDRGSPITVVAVHGGGIEWGSSHAAKALAKDKYNLYLFECIRPKGCRDLHVTSHKFNDQRLHDLVKRSQWVVSFHGFKDRQNPWILFGGLNEELAQSAYEEVLATGLIHQEVLNPADRLHGHHPENFVNLSAQQGVQLEMSTVIRNLITEDPEALKQLTTALENTLSSLEK